MLIPVQVFYCSTIQSANMERDAVGEVGVFPGVPIARMMLVNEKEMVEAGTSRCKIPRLTVLF